MLWDSRHAPLRVVLVVVGLGCAPDARDASDQRRFARGVWLLNNCLENIDQDACGVPGPRVIGIDSTQEHYLRRRPERCARGTRWQTKWGTNIGEGERGPSTRPGRLCWARKIGRVFLRARRYRLTAASRSPVRERCPQVSPR